MKFVQRLFLSREQPRRLRTGWRLAVHGVLFVALMALFTPLSVLAARAVGAPVLSSVVAEAAAITLATWAARRWLDRRPFVSLGLRLNRRAWRDFAAGTVIAALTQTALLGLLAATGAAVPYWNGFSGAGAARALAEAFVLWLLVGWSEELWMRGYWLQNIAEAAGLKWGVAVSSVFFALLHLANPHVNVLAEVGLIAAGLFLAYGYVRSGALWLPLGLHFGWNLFEGTVYGFPVSGLGGFHLLNTPLQGPVWLTGGAFGPEASLTVLVVLAFGAVLIGRYTAGRGERGGMDA